MIGGESSSGAGKVKARLAASCGLGAEAVDETLQVLAAGVLLLRLRLGNGEPRRARLREGIVGAAVEREPAIL